MASTRAQSTATPVQEARLTRILGNNALIENQISKVGDIAGTGQQIRTTQARTQIEFNTGSLSRLGANSVFTVGSSCLNLTAGKILVNGASTLCFGTVVIGVQGTTYQVDVIDPNRARIGVLEGTVQVSSTTRPTDPPILLRGGEEMDAFRDGTLKPPRAMSLSDYSTDVNGDLMESFNRLPNADKIRLQFLKLFPFEPVPPTIAKPLDNTQNNDHNQDSRSRGNSSSP